jgi:hypothetical protein
MSLGFAERTCHCTYGEDQGGGKDDSKDRNRDKFKGKDEGKNTDNSKDYSKGKGTDSNDNEDTDSMDKDKDNSKGCSKPTPSENDNKTTDSMAKDNSKNSSNQFPQKLAPWSYDPCTDKSKLSDTHSSNDNNSDTDCEQHEQLPPCANKVPKTKKLLPIPPPPDVHDPNRTCTDLPKSDDESEPPLPPVPPPPERVSNARSRATPDPDPKSRDSAGVGRSSLASGGWSVCEESPSLNSHSCSVSSPVVSEISMFEQCSDLAAPKSMHVFFLSQGPGSMEYP